MKHYKVYRPSLSLGKWKFWHHNPTYFNNVSYHNCNSKTNSVIFQHDEALPNWSLASIMAKKSRCMGHITRKTTMI